MTYHVVPTDDLRDHEVEVAGQCWCDPQYDPEYDVWLHFALDEREKYETGERKPN
jgi:hypothetical protein